MNEFTEGRKVSFWRSAARRAWNDRTALWWLTGLAILARLAYVLVAGKAELSWGDEFVYDQLAHNLPQYKCFCFVEGQPTVWRAPLYPAMLALVYVIGHSHMAVLVIQALAGGLSAPLLVAIGSRLSGSRWVGLAAGLMFALNPLVVFMTGLLYAETFYLPILFVIVYAWVKLMDEPANWMALAIGSGLLLGLSNLMKPNLLLFPIWLLVWGWAAFRKLSKAIVVSTVIGLAMLVAVLPWIVRNYLVTGEFVPISLSGSIAFYQGNNPRAAGGGIDETTEIDPLSGLSETERSVVYRQWATEWIRTHPADFARLIPLKLYRFFSPLETSVRGQVVTSFSSLVYAGFALFYLLAVVGMIRTAGKWRRWLLVHMMIVYPALLTVVFYGGTRYGLVVQPFLMLFAAEALIALASRLPVFSGFLSAGTEAKA